MGRIRASEIEKSGMGRVVGAHDPYLSADPAEIPYPLVQSEQELISDPGIDALFVCTSNEKIPGLCQAALAAGKHVFSEKPPAFNAEQVLEVRRAESEAGDRKLMYGFNHRHHESIRRMKAIVTSGEMGRVLWMRGRYGKEVDETFFTGWRADRKRSGGGILLDQGIHMVDLFLHLAGGFDEVRAFVSNLYWKIEGIEDNVFAILRNRETGVCASLHSTMTQWRYLFSLEVFLEGGALILNGLKTSSGAYGEERLAIKRNSSHLHDGRFESEEDILFNIDRSWQSEVDHFFGCILENRPVEYGNSLEALQLMKLIDRIYEEGRMQG